MKKVINTAKNIWKDESGQGAVEYILLLVVVVGIITMLKEPLKNSLGGSVKKLTDQIQGFNGN